MDGGEAAGVGEGDGGVVPGVAFVVVDGDAAVAGDPLGEGAGHAVEQVEVVAVELVERAAAGGVGEAPVARFSAGQLRVGVLPDVGAGVPVAGASSSG